MNNPTERIPRIVAKIAEAGCLLSVKCNDFLFLFFSFAAILLPLYLRFLIVLRYILVHKVHKRYPDNPPNVFIIISSTSHEPSLVTNCTASTTQDARQLMRVIRITPHLRRDRIGSTNPSGIKQTTFPIRFSITPK